MRAVQVEKMLNNLVGRDLTLYIARPDPVPRNDQERRRALITLQNELNRAKGECGVACAGVNLRRCEFVKV